MKTLLPVLCLAMLLASSCVTTETLTELPYVAPNPTAPPKHEFRGVWVATVANIDFPSAPGLPVPTLKSEWDELLDYVEDVGLNAVIVQIRPAGDALYPTQLAPWSRYLTGEQGKAPSDPTFDPVAYMIETARERGIEFHAWLNPYRATMNLDTDALAPNHMLNQHPEWFLQYGKKFYFNPALPEVRQHIVDVVGEVVDRYDIDAIHFDDYFYPYKLKDTPFPDDRSFTQYGAGFSNIADWRRANTSMLIEAVDARIESSKPWVRFGISPFGVWRNSAVDADRGSQTRAGQTSYDDLYADILTWLEQGWIDYVAPQLYWSIGYDLADYETLLYWWGNHTFGRNLYIGQAAYKVGNNPVEDWKRGSEINRQIALNREVSTVDGSIFFSLRSLRGNSLNFVDSLRTEAYEYFALPPRVRGEGYVAPEPVKLKKVKRKRDGIRLRWEVDDDILAAPQRYVIYRFNGEGLGDLGDPRNILMVTEGTMAEKIIEYDPTAVPGRVYTYAVTAFNQQNLESEVRGLRTVEIRENGVKRVKSVEVE